MVCKVCFRGEKLEDCKKALYFSREALELNKSKKKKMKCYCCREDSELRPVLLGSCGSN